MKKIYSRKQKRKKIIKYIIKLLTLLCLVCFAYSIYHLIIWKKDTNTNKKIKEKTNKIVEIIENTDNKAEFKINWEEMKKTNSDAIAYLKINNTNVNYIVVKGQDNEYYLNHNLNKKKNIAGWIFSDYKNKFDGTDKNIVIFGHNIVDKSMFGSIPDMFTKQWYEEPSNLDISLITEKENMTYRIFSMYTIEAEEYYIQTQFSNDSHYQEFLNTIKKRSFYNFKEELNSNDSILTLSTCTPDGKSRMVVHAKLVT